MIAAVEAKDLPSIESLLSPDVRKIFPYSPDPLAKSGAVFIGRDEVMQYYRAVFAKFDSLRWLEQDWTASADGARAFLQAKGEIVVSHSKASYRNIYINRYDTENGQIARMLEYANPALYEDLGIKPAPVEIDAVVRGRGYNP